MSLYDKIVTAQEATKKVERSAKKINFSETIRSMVKLVIVLEDIKNDNSD